MYGHERSLVEKYKGRPFVLLGVNTDEDAAALRKVQQEQNITWRSFSDGPPGGPLTRQWGVQGFPTVVLIDADGVIRYAAAGPPDPKTFDPQVEDLVRKAEK
jgi:hypothetical protein